MNDRHILPESEVVGVLEDAASAHRNDAGTQADIEEHEAVAALIDRILAGGNSAWRRKAR